MTGALGYIVVALLSALGGFLGGWSTGGARISDLEIRIVAAEAAIARQVEMIELMVTALTNIVVVANTEQSEQSRAISTLARRALST